MRLSQIIGKFFLSAFLLFLASCSSGEEENRIIFKNVSVLDTRLECILPGRTVIVEDGVISSILEKNDTTPSGRIIDGTGLTLMPGLTDMHVHLEWFSSPDILPLFLLHGVTFVRQMDGRPEHLEWRDKVEDGNLIGPFIHVGGKILEGPDPLWDDTQVVTTPEEALAAVNTQKEAGYDFIKVYHTLPDLLYRVIVQRAQELNLAVAGHVPIPTGLEGVLNSGQKSIEHFTAFIRPIAADGAEVSPHLGFMGYLYFAIEVDPEKQQEAANKTQQSGIFVVPTLSVQGRAIEALTAPEADIPYSEYLSQDLLSFWRGSLEYAADDFGPEGIEETKAGFSRKLALLKSLHDARVPLLIGTDTPQPYVVPGLSALQEMGEFSKAGLSNAEVLKIAITGPNGLIDNFPGGGIIEVGQAANFILVEGNPLENLKALDSVQGVMMGQKWLTREDILQFLENRN